MAVTGVDVRRVLLFVGFTYAVSWLLLAVFALGEGGVASIPPVATTIYVFIPGMVAIGMQSLANRGWLVHPLGIPLYFNRWLVVAWLGPALFALAVAGVAMLLPGVHPLWQVSGEETLPPFWLVLLQTLLAGMTVYAVASFGEELGWRGYLLKEAGSLGFWRSSFLIGLIWGGWYAPLVLLGRFFPDHPWPGVLLTIAFTTLAAPLFTYVRLKAGSVLATSVMHGSLHAGAVPVALLVVGGVEWGTGLRGLVALGFLLALNVALRLHLRGREPLEMPSP